MLYFWSHIPPSKTEMPGGEQVRRGISGKLESKALCAC